MPKFSCLSFSVIRKSHRSLKEHQFDLSGANLLIIQEEPIYQIRTLSLIDLEVNLRFCGALERSDYSISIFENHKVKNCHKKSNGG